MIKSEVSTTHMVEIRSVITDHDVNNFTYFIFK